MKTEKIPVSREIYTGADDGCDFIIAMLRHSNELNHKYYTHYTATELSLEGAIASYVDKSGSEGVWAFDEGVLHLELDTNKGVVRVYGFGISAGNAKAVTERAEHYCPVDEGSQTNEIACQFWRYSMSEGPKQSKRNLDAISWDEIKGNYPHAAGLGHLMTDFRPGVGGQLILFRGDAGVGKTTALRALACEWRDWATLHYIVDPEVFFGASADYMMQILIDDSNKNSWHDLVGEDDEEKEPQWRLVVLEDSGEMLKADAKQEVGQALSRLLNVCDGLIGRGLRFLILVTTNEEVGKLNEAVSRPGRCAAKVEFKPFSVDEANTWLASNGSEEVVSGGKSLAELYALLNAFDNSEQDSVALGFR